MWLCQFQKCLVASARLNLSPWRQFQKFYVCFSEMESISAILMKFSLSQWGRVSNGWSSFRKFESVSAGLGRFQQVRFVAVSVSAILCQFQRDSVCFSEVVSLSAELDLFQRDWIIFLEVRLKMIIFSFYSRFNSFAFGRSKEATPPWSAQKSSFLTVRKYKIDLNCDVYFLLIILNWWLFS